MYQPQSNQGWFPLQNDNIKGFSPQLNLLLQKNNKKNINIDILKNWLFEQVIYLKFIPNDSIIHVIKR